MNEFERAEKKHAKNKIRNDAYVHKQAEVKLASKPSVKRCSVTLIINDGSEHSITWDAAQLLGTVIPGQRTKDWYMKTAKDALEKHFGRLSCQ